MLSNAQIKRRNVLIESLRELADFYEQHPDLRAPVGRVEFNLICHTKEEFLEARRASGLQEKKFLDSFCCFHKPLPDTGYFDIVIERDKVCTRVKVGEVIIPAKPATPEQVVDKYEWVCDDPILAGKGASHAK